jgi:hypothetical protein
MVISLFWDRMRAGLGWTFSNLTAEIPTDNMKAAG